MKLFSSILASALVFHLVHSIVIKINPIRVQVRPTPAINTTSSTVYFSTESSAQLGTATNELESNASFGSGSVSPSNSANDQIATEKCSSNNGNVDKEITTIEIGTLRVTGTDFSSPSSFSNDYNTTQHLVVTESNSKHESTSQTVTLQQFENVSTISSPTANQSVIKNGFGNDSSTQYSSVTDGEITKQSSIWLLTDKIATKGSTFVYSDFTKKNATANTTSTSTKVGLPCKIAYPSSSPASKDDSSPKNETNVVISKTASTVDLSSIKSSTLDIYPDHFSKAQTEANFENVEEGPEDSDEEQIISNSSTVHSGSTHSTSSILDKFDFTNVSTVGGSTAVDSEKQISASQSVKTATPHSDSYPDFENKKQSNESGSSTSQSSLQDDKKSSSGCKTNQEKNVTVFSPASTASQSSSDSVTLQQIKENASSEGEEASPLPTIYNSPEMSQSQTISSVSSTTEEFKLQTVAQSTKLTSDSSTKVSLESAASDQEMQTSIPLEGEEDQIVTTIESYSFQESVAVSSTTENKTYSSSEARADQQEWNTSVESATLVPIKETTQPNQCKRSSSITNISQTPEQSINTENTTQTESSSDDQWHKISESSTISSTQSSAANTSENITTAFHISTDSSQTTDLGSDRSSSPGAVSRPPTCKTTKTNHSSSNLNEPTPQSSTSRALTEEEKKTRRLTISNKNPNLAKKLTRVTPLKGNISSNAGFLMANRKYGARLFFWFFRSLHNTTDAPVIVWLQGQPGWSSLVGLFEEHGPYRVVETDTDIRFELREHAWTNEFNVLYLDHCIGCGYSTAMRKAAYEPTYEMVSANVYQALVQFFRVFSEYAENEVYLAGEHGCAKYIPIIADTIHTKNAIEQDQINLRGILIGGPYIDALSMITYSEYLYMTGLIDEQEHENLYIQEQYAKSLILATKYNETITYLKQNVLNKFEQAGYQRLYDLRYEKPKEGHYTFERYMPKVVKYEPFVASIHTEGLQFRTRSELLIEEIMKPVDQVLTTVLQHYKVLYYNGQFDMLTPYSLTAQYFSQLHWAKTNFFYSSQLNNWHASSGGYPDGYWKFSSNLTHVVIRDAGHTVGTTKPHTLLYMLKWFVNDMFEISYSPPSPDQRYLNIFI